jgi:hypothetical protein
LEAQLDNGKELKMRAGKLPLVLVGLMIGLAGCVFSIGGSSATNAPTKGQQLIDLKNALDRGAISQQEYYQQKQQILSRQP